VPAITASPAGPTSAMSKAGMTASPLPSERGGAPIAGAITRESDPSSPPLAVGAATAAAAIASPVFTGVCLSRGKPETNAAPDAAVSARRRMAIRPIHMGAMIRNPWPSRWLVLHPPKSMMRRSVSAIKSAQPIPCGLRNNPEDARGGGRKVASSMGKPIACVTLIVGNSRHGRPCGKSVMARPSDQAAPSVGENRFDAVTDR